MSQKTDGAATAPDTKSKPESGLWYGYKQEPPEVCGLFDYLGGRYIWECGALSRTPMHEWTAHLRERRLRIFGA
ncbi:MAG: hypothetical protein WC050_01660 [Candidatus Paceibacterota bacterium]